MTTQQPGKGEVMSIVDGFRKQLDEIRELHLRQTKKLLGEIDDRNGRLMSIKRRPPPKARGTIKLRDGGTKTIPLTRGKAIKIFCTECMGWEGNPRDCTATTCPLYSFRGKSLEAYRRGLE